MAPWIVEKNKELQLKYVSLGDLMVQGRTMQCPQSGVTTPYPEHRFITDSTFSQDPDRSMSDKKRTGQLKSAHSQAGIEALEQTLDMERRVRN